MKFLDCPSLQALVAPFLNGFDAGDRVIFANVEVYSLKKTNSDKKFSKEMERQYVEELATSPGSLSRSPLGPMTDSSVRKLLINLISTMNASFPDYDFRTARPEQFVAELNHQLVCSHINSNLCEAVEKIHPGFQQKLWAEMSSIINTNQCLIYSYIPDFESDPLIDGKLWSFNYFFFNKKLKKIVFFSASAKLKSMISEEDNFEEDDVEEDLDDNVDMREHWTVNEMENDFKIGTY